MASCENGIGTRSLSSSSRSQITGTRENGSAYSREKVEILLLIIIARRSNEFWVFTCNHFLSFDKSFTFEGDRVTNFESIALKLKSLKTILAIITSWKVTAAIKDRKENAARRTVTAMIILANIMRCFKVTQLLANCCCCCLYLLSFLCLYSFDNTCFCEKFLNNE